MANTKMFSLRVSEEMIDAIEHWADDEMRSTNGQIEYLLRQALRKHGRMNKKLCPDCGAHKKNSA